MNTILFFLPVIVTLVLVSLIVYLVVLQRRSTRNQSDGLQMVTKSIALQDRTLAVLEKILAEMKRGSGSGQ